MIPIVGMAIWLVVTLLIAKAVNAVAKRPVMNPWTWFGAMYVGAYVLGIAWAFIKGTPNFYMMGYWLVPVAAAGALWMWQGPRWRAKHPDQGRAPTTIDPAQDLRYRASDAGPPDIRE